MISYIPRKLTQESINKIIKLYQSGRSVNSIAVDFRIHHTTIMNLIERLGVTMVSLPVRIPKKRVRLFVNPYEKIVKDAVDKPESYKQFVGKKEFIGMMEKQKNCKHRIVKEGKCWLCWKKM